jgi:peroxiredoxin
MPAHDRHRIAPHHLMTLNGKLASWWENTRERAPEVWDAYTLFVRELRVADVARFCLKRGDRIPPFTLPNVEGRLVSARELLAHGPLVLSFFRGGWCPYCTMELRALQEAWPEIQRRGANLAAVTPDTGTSLRSDKRANDLDYQVLSDVDNGLALLFGLVFRVPAYIRALWLKHNIDLGARHGNSSGTWLLPLPATYIIDRQGIILHADVDPDFRRRLDPTDILRLLGTRRR